MDIKITPHTLSGTAIMPPSKSYSHRALICAALGGGDAIHISDSEDIRATKGCLEALKNKGNMFANESGSTLRFMIPIALAVNGECNISGSERLMQRPLGDYFEIFDKNGIEYSLDGTYLHAKGNLSGGDFYLRGDVSSQFITGLLFALPLLPNDSTIHITTQLESKAYVDMTICVLKKYGVEVSEVENGYFIKGKQEYKPFDYVVEGDFSQAAFFPQMGNVTIKGLNRDSIQGDRAIIDIYRRMGMTIEDDGDDYVSKSGTWKNIDVDASQIPDCVPALASVMALGEGEGKIYNAARLRIKESDRLRAVYEELTALGADVTEGEDYLIIRGKKELDGGVCSSHNDHRIAMALASITPYCKNEVVIKGAECVKKSMPDFWDKFRSLGGVADEFNVGKQY